MNICECKLCKEGRPKYLQQKAAGWRQMIYAIFDYFPAAYPELHRDGWFYFPEFIKYSFQHWHVLCPLEHLNDIDGTESYTITPSERRWHKAVRDTLAHNKRFFVCGKEQFARTGKILNSQNN